jgi:hypothetical protein
MPHKPDYDNARQKAGFNWRVSAGAGAYRELAGVPIREFYLNPQACIEAYRKGRPLARAMFGDAVGYAGPATPPISYGHVSCLGAELLFPEGGEVSFVPIYASLDEAIDALRGPVDWASAGMAPFYLEFRQKMKAAFPGEEVGFGFGYEGPITTAWEMRGHGFFTDIYDHPGKVREFLALATASIVAYAQFDREVNGRPRVDPGGASMADDISAMMPPGIMGELVVPFWEQYYAGLTTGERHAHIEDLRPRQLAYLEQIGLDSYDPSISPRLNPRIAFAECRVPFSWRLAGFLYRDMSEQDVRDFVYQAAAEGASGVYTVVAEPMCNPDGAAKIKAFVEAGQRAKELLDSGAEREAVGEMVSPGRRDAFAGYLG